MKTFDLKISNRINVTKWCDAYSCMERKLYTNFELSEDKNYQKELRKQFGLDSWFFESCKTDVKMRLDQKETQTKQKLRKIDDLKKVLEKEEFVGRKGRRRKFNMITKLNYLETHIDREIVFGTKALLRKLSFLPNQILLLQEKLKSEKKKKEQKKIEVEIRNTRTEIIKCKREWRKRRSHQILSIGETPQKSNRKFDFDFVNKKLFFKPEHGIKIEVQFHCSEGQYGELVKLQQQIGQQAITIRLDNDHVCISFDNEKLAGYDFNEREYFRELKMIPKENKDERKECYIKWITEQKNRKFANKNVNRFISFDLNPEYIGVAVLQKLFNGKFKIIFAHCFSLVNLNTRLGLGSTDEKQVYQNDKRIHEIHEVWKRAFVLAQHYKVSHCVIEDLDFREKTINDMSTESNRKTKNIWHRTLTATAINKYCAELGIILIPVNAAYSSFVGNIKHRLFDPVSAAIEIGRRGITKYLKGQFYPSLERTDFDTMCQLGLDVQDKTISTWVQAYKLFKTSGLRYRWGLNNLSGSNLSSHKSGVLSYNF